MPVFVVGWGANMFASRLHASARLSGTRADGLFGAYALGLRVGHRRRTAPAGRRLGSRRGVTARRPCSSAPGCVVVFGVLCFSRRRDGRQRAAARFGRPLSITVVW